MGELGLPYVVQCAALFTLNTAFSSNPLGFFVLTRCAADLLEAHGDDVLKAEYLPRLRSGEWFGTMALSEPHAGSSLSSIRTLARRVGEGSREYRLRGNKMWTSGAFHDATGNVIHMLLARIEGEQTPAGARGTGLDLHERGVWS